MNRYTSAKKLIALIKNEKVILIVGVARSAGTYAEGALPGIQFSPQHR